MRKQRRGLTRVHCREDAMHSLIATGSKYRCSQDVLTFRIDKHFDVSERFAFLDGATNARHRSNADQRGLPTMAYLGLSHSNVGKRRIDVNGICGDTIAYAARSLVQQVIRSEEHTSELQSLTNLVCR